MTFRAHARNAAGESAVFYASTKARLRDLASLVGMEIEAIEFREFEEQAKWVKVAA